MTIARDASKAQHMSDQIWYDPLMKRSHHPPISKDDVEALTRGLPTKSRVGDITVGHRLTKRERGIFARAKRDGYLSLPYVPIRDNVVNIYLKWCEAVGRTPEVRRKGDHAQ